MTPAEHRANAERLMSAASFYTADPSKDHDAHSLVAEASLLTAQAQVHATLALAPPPATSQPPQTRWDLNRPAYINDATGGQLSVTPAADKSGLVFNYDEDSWLIEDPSTLREFASLLTAHADRLESRS